jgi:hypothetical protein
MLRRVFFKQTAEEEAPALASVSETAPDADEDLRPLRIVGPEPQETAKVGDGVRDTGEVDVVDFALLNFFYLVIQPLVEIALNGFNLERSVEFGPDVNGFGDSLSAGSPQNDIPGGQFNGCLDERFNFYVFKRMPWIIGVDPGGLSQFPIVASGIDLECDFALPTGGDLPIEIGHSTASAGADLSYLKGFVARVSDLKGVGHNRAFIDFFEVEVLFFDDHPRPGRMPGWGSGEECTEEKEGQTKKV